MRLNSGNASFVGAGLCKLCDRFPGRVLEQDFVLFSLATDGMRRDIDRDAMVRADCVQATEIEFGERVEIEHLHFPSRGPGCLAYRRQRFRFGNALSPV
jgi:hypothetical protein